MKRNSFLQIRIETEILHKLRNKAKSSGLSLSEFCRQKILGSSQLDKIEYMLREVLSKR